MFKKISILFFFLSLIFIFYCSAGSGSSGPGTESGIHYEPFSSFLSVSGADFSGGFKFSGANIDPWRFITGSGEVYSQNEIRAWVRNAINYTGVKAVRMHINGGAFEPAIGSYNEAAFKQLDYLIAACVEYKVYILIALRDYIWGPWPPTAYDPYWFINAGSTNKDAVLTNTAAKTYFKNFISYVLNRANTVTGTVYKNDKNIMGWELINEPNFINGVISNWLKEMGTYVKGIDPNHLVSVGIGGAEQIWWDTGQPNWSEINIPQLDFIDLHYYAAESYYNPVDPGNTAKIKERVSNVITLNKPAVIGEFGCVTTNPLAVMSNLYDTVITAAGSAGAGGILPYAWGPPGPNGWGGTGSFDIYTNNTELCGLLKSLAP